MLNLLTAFCNFYRQENCYRCLHVYLSVPDCCATGRERSPEWGWRDDKVQPHKFWHLDVQTRSHKGDMLQIQYCSSWMDPRFILGSRLKYFFSQLLAVFLSHLMGMFYRTIRMLEHGIKPVYVFDGKPPQLKSAEVCMGSDFHRCHSPW